MKDKILSTLEDYWEDGKYKEFPKGPQLWVKRSTGDAVVLYGYAIDKSWSGGMKFLMEDCNNNCAWELFQISLTGITDYEQIHTIEDQVQSCQ